jgi:hypothetical protein
MPNSNIAELFSAQLFGVVLLSSNLLRENLH